MIDTKGTLHRDFIAILQDIADGKETDKSRITKKIQETEHYFHEQLGYWREDCEKAVADEYAKRSNAIIAHSKRADFIAAVLLNPDDVMHEWALSFLETVKAENEPKSGCE